MSQFRMIAVAITTASGGAVKRVQRELLPLYLREGWHVVPRRRFKVAKRRHEKVAQQ